MISPFVSHSAFGTVTLGGEKQITVSQKERDVNPAEKHVWLEAELGFGDRGQTILRLQAWECLPAQCALECAGIQELNVKQKDF